MLAPIRRGVRDALRQARIYAKLELLQIRTHLEYEADFWIGIVGALLTQVSGFVFIWSVFGRVPVVAGWTFWEVAVLYALATIPRGFASALCDGPWRLRALVNGGQFDRFLVRPISPALQVATQLSSMHGFGTAALGFYILASASAALHLTWDVPRIAFLVVTLVCSLVIICAVNYCTNCIAFWEQGASGAVPYAVAQLLEFARYPLTLYGRVVQVVVTWVVPVAFCGYYPGAFLLGKEVDPAWLPPWSPLAAPAVVLVTSLIWRASINRYQGTGH